MGIYKYSCRDQSGAKVEGTLESSDITKAKDELENKGLFVVSVKEHVTAGKSLFPSGNKVGLKELEFITSEISVLLDAGVRIDKAIGILSRNAKQHAVQFLLNKIDQDLKSGSRLSDALSKHEKIFDILYINLVSLGEETGNLKDVFKELSAEMSYRRELSQKISQSLTYPFVILAVCIASLVFIFNFVVPNLATIFKGSKDLPFYTQFLLGASAWMIQYQYWLLATFIACFAFIWLKRDSKEFAIVKSKMSMMPLIDNVTLLVERIRFTSSLSMMLKSGVVIDKAISLSAGSIRNVSIREEVAVASEKIKKGSQLSAALAQTSIFSDYFTSLLVIGEESGELARIFDEIAKRSRSQFSAWTSKLTSLLEPLMILIMGGIVGSVVVAMMLSITSVNDVGL